VKPALGAVELNKIINLCPKGRVRQTKMFGCLVVFVDGKMFAGIYRRSLFICVGIKRKGELIDSGFAMPFVARGRQMREYITFALPLEISSRTLTKEIKIALRNR
jgi:TfoX/Sxy family transcriptional regulator of competence genes